MTNLISLSYKVFWDLISYSLIEWNVWECKWCRDNTHGLIVFSFCSYRNRNQCATQYISHSVVLKSVTHRRVKQCAFCCETPGKVHISAFSWVSISLVFIRRINTIWLSSKLFCFDAAMFLMVKLINDTNFYILYNLPEPPPHRLWIR